MVAKPVWDTEEDGYLNGVNETIKIFETARGFQYLYDATKAAHLIK
jgi:hypothetical protein